MNAGAQFTVETDPAPQEVWYRYVNGRYAPPLDEFERPCGRGEAYLHLLEFAVLRHTPCGVWLSSAGEFGLPRFVLRSSRKRFACPTKEEAVESFRARKAKEIRILRGKIADAEAALALLDGETEP